MTKKLSTVSKLFQAAALAAFILCLIPSAAKGSTITCAFGVTQSQSDTQSCVGGDFDDGGLNTRATFYYQYFNDPYSFSLDFDTVLQPFYVTVSDTQVPKPVFDTTENLPAGQGCVPIADGSTTCVYFTVLNPPVDGVDWTGNYQVLIAWDLVTPYDSGLHLVHQALTDEGFQDITTGYTFTVPDPPCPGCAFFGDASIGGEDNNFTRFAPTSATPIPEPASVVLLTTGLGAFLYRKRRERQDSNR